MLKMICFDMDGTLADLYGVPHWEDKLNASDPSPYLEAQALYPDETLRQVLIQAIKQGILVGVITWLSMGSTNTYKTRTRQAKKEWLKAHGIPCQFFHGITYGATKADCVRCKLQEGEQAILVDDNPKVRKGWTLGDTIDPTQGDLIEKLYELLDS